MNPIRFIAVIAAVLTAFSAATAAAAPAREFEGTVVSVNRDAHTFRLNDVERGTVRIEVTRNTRFERIDGLSGLKAGAKRHRSDRQAQERRLGGDRGRALRGWRGARRRRLDHRV